jgi:hypothetical protein
MAEKWWRRIPWPMLALLGWSLAGVFGVVAAIERIQLQNRHFHIEWGNAAAWLGGVGAFAAFGALFYAALQWRVAQTERRDREADQARLIVTESYSSKNFDDESVVVRNHSEAPIFDVQLFTHRQHLSGALLSAGVDKFLEEADPTEAYAPVLRPGDATTPALEVTSPDYAPAPDVRNYANPFGFTAVTFTDARGRRWWRFGTNQPRRATPEWMIWIH